MKDIYTTNVRFKSIIEPYTHFCLYKQPKCEGSSVENGLKVQQLAKQPSMLTTLVQKNLVGI